MSINYTYQGNMMYLYTLKVHCNIDVTLVGHSCEIDEVFSHCLLSFYSTSCLLLTLMKATRCICNIKSSQQYRCNLIRTQL